jgi:adenine phosphoribosyltransferase
MTETLYTANHSNVAYDDMVRNVTNRIHRIEDFPKEGVVFFDVLEVFADPKAHNSLLALMTQQLHAVKNVHVIVGLESRGFLMGPALAAILNCRFVCARKAGKLPGAVVSKSYKKEYGEDTIEMQFGSIRPGDRVVIVDDLIATGGTMNAAIEIIRSMGGVVVHAMCIVDIKRDNYKLADVPVWCVMDV